MDSFSIMTHQAASAVMLPLMIPCDDSSQVVAADFAYYFRETTAAETVADPTVYHDEFDYDNVLPLAFPTAVTSAPTVAAEPEEEPPLRRRNNRIYNRIILRQIVDTPLTSPLNSLIACSLLSSCFLQMNPINLIAIVTPPGAPRRATPTGNVAEDLQGAPELPVMTPTNSRASTAECDTVPSRAWFDSPIWQAYLDDLVDFPPMPPMPAFPGHEEEDED